MTGANDPDLTVALTWSMATLSSQTFYISSVEMAISLSCWWFQCNVMATVDFNKEFKKFQFESLIKIDFPEGGVAAENFFN